MIGCAIKLFHKIFSHTLWNSEVNVVSLKHKSAIFYLYKVLDEFCLVKIEMIVWISKFSVSFLLMIGKWNTDVCFMLNSYEIYS